MIYGSSMTDPNYANYQGSQTYNYKPAASSPTYGTTNYQGLPQISTSPTNTTSGGTSGGQVLGTTATAPTVDPYQEQINQQNQQLRNEISSGYDSYIASLDELYNSGFTTQQQAQQEIVQNQLKQGQSTLDSQLKMGNYDLANEENKVNTNQVKTLKDVSSNIRNLMQAGNTYLGSRGAGDSSAVNQYSYALTKLGSQQRGDVQSQTANLLGEIAGRKFKLTTMYNNEINNLNTETNTKMLQIQQDFAAKQNEIYMMKAQAGLNKNIDLTNLSKSLYENSVNQLNQIKAETANKRAMLEQWAMNNSTTLSQLKQNLATVSNYQAPAQTYTPISNNNGNISYAGPSSSNPTYGGYSDNNNLDDLFA